MNFITNAVRLCKTIWSPHHFQANCFLLGEMQKQSQSYLPSSVALVLDQRDFPGAAEPWKAREGIPWRLLCHVTHCRCEALATWEKTCSSQRHNTPISVLPKFLLSFLLNSGPWFFLTFGARTQAQKNPNRKCSGVQLLKTFTYHLT